MYDTVIFDLDGTLLNTIDDLANAVNYVQKNYGYPMDNVNTVKKNVGNGIKKLIERSIPEGKNNPYFEKIFLEFKEYYQKNCQVKTSAYPGIMELLETLKNKKIKMAIVSNKAHEAVEKLNRIYFQDYVSVVIGENEAAGIRKKPAADSVKRVLELLKSKKEETLYVGDSEVDKETADNAHVRCVLCSWGFRETEQLKKLEPMAVINHPLELLDIITEP